MPLRTLADADILRERLAAAGAVVVVGAGFIGLEFASVAIAAGAAVHIVEVTRQPMGRVVSAPISRFFTGAHRGWGATISLGAGGRAHRRRRRPGRRGRDRRRPGAAGRSRAGLHRRPAQCRARPRRRARGRRTASSSTNISRPAPTAISAIGDCANFPTRFAVGRVRLESVQNGVDQASGGRRPHRRQAGTAYDKVPWFWSDQADLKLQIAGITAGHDAAVVRGDPESGSFSVFCFRERRA